MAKTLLSKPSLKLIDSWMFSSFHPANWVNFTKKLGNKKWYHVDLFNNLTIHQIQKNREQIASKCRNCNQIQVLPSLVLFFLRLVGG